MFKRIKSETTDFTFLNSISLIRKGAGFTPHLLAEKPKGLKRLLSLLGQGGWLTAVTNTQQVRYRQPKGAGFTLLEAIIGIGVVSVAGIAVLTLLNSSLTAARVNKDLLVVVNLTREGIEIARAVRDSDGFVVLVPGSYIVDSDTNFNLSQAAQGVQASNPDIDDCTNCTLSQVNSRYVHAISGTVTKYDRMVTIEDVTGTLTCAGAGVCHRRVTATVAWQDGTNTRNYSVVVDLTDWR